MPNESQRLVEIRLLVVVFVDVTSDALIETLRTRKQTTTSVPEVVAEEVCSNLESVPFVETAIVSRW